MISAVVIAKNEEHNIVRCVQSLSWADEVVVIDDHSEDDTKQLAIENGARVLTHSFESFAAQRNWALDHGDLRNDWVVMLDADEWSTPEFAECTQREIANVTVDCVGFRTCRKTMLNGKWLRFSDGFPVWIMRIVRRGHARFEDSGHGEVPVPNVQGMINTIREPFMHNPFSRGLADWWSRHVRYAQREAAKERSMMDDGRVNEILSKDRSRRRAGLRKLSRSMPFRGGLRFLYQYILKGGFLDGQAGLQFCRMMACYEIMIVTLTTNDTTQQIGSAEKTEPTNREGEASDG